MSSKKEKSIPRTTKGPKANYRKTTAGAGMSRDGVKAYRKANPTSKLKTAVTGKVKKNSPAAKRRKSYCARSAGQIELLLEVPRGCGPRVLKGPPRIRPLNSRLAPLK